MHSLCAPHKKSNNDIIYPLMPLIELDHVSFQYPSAPAAALDDVSLAIREGERVAIVGANGSGKTTLARLLNALYLPTGGRVRVAGMDTADLARHRAIRQVVGMVFQNPEDQLVAAVVEEDVAFGLENLGIPSAQMRPQVDALLQAFDLWDHRLRPPFMLSAGQMQRLALAGVLAVQPQVIVFDETTAMLDPAGRRTVMARIDELHRAGTTIISITHFMGEAARAERVIVLSHGRVALDGPPGEVFSDPQRLFSLGLHLPPAAALARALRPVMPNLPPNLLNTTDLLEALPACPSPAAAAPDGDPGPRMATPEWIRVAGLGHVYLQGTPLAHRALGGANLLVGQGEVHGLAGATGSGKSTLLQHLNGLLIPQEGQVTVGPHRLHEPGADRYAVRRLAGLAFQNPEVQLFETFVGDEIAYGPRQAGLDRPALREAVRWAMERVGLDFEAFKDRRSFALSGGERKKVALASILARRPEILLLDEPLAGLDPRSRDELLVTLRNLVDLGLTLVVSSHQMDDLAGLVDAATLMSGGRDVLDGPVGVVFEREDDLLVSGLEAPVAARAAIELRRKGWPLPPGLVTPEKLLAALARLRAA
jgi:energy-coupling factor transporter ATPase